MKKRIIEAIEASRKEIFACGEYILNNPEMGFKEFKTSEYVKNEFKKLGIPFQENLAITGVMGVIGNPNADINICIIGEMDAVKCYGHPYTDEATGAAHACGHHVQVAQMIGVAYGIVNSGILEEIDCKITFLAVPAEEFVEVDYRQHLIDNGKITHMSGKQELIHLGIFDDIDIAMMLHSHALTPKPHLHMKGSSLGFEAKRITFTGKAAHGSEPWNGVNALDAAVLTITGINANRSTFKESDNIRIHPIISNGGELVNVIPNNTVIETYVRSSNKSALADACHMVDNAAQAGAMAVGATCAIKNIRGYAPLHQDENLSEVFENNALMFLKPENVEYYQNMTGSTDMGDLSSIIPVIQPTIGGFDGALHSKEFLVANKEFVYITATKILACSVYDLIKDNAKKARSIKDNFKVESK